MTNVIDALIVTISLVGLCVLLLTSPVWSQWIDAIGEPMPVLECKERTLA